MKASDLISWRVLVVDDDADSLRMIDMMLGYFNIVSLPAANGAKALELLKQDPEINILMFDIQMPTMTGFDLLHIVRTSDLWCGLPIIAVTARAIFGERERMQAAGFDGYIVKPFDTETLIDLVRSILAKVELTHKSTITNTNHTLFFTPHP